MKLEGIIACICEGNAEQAIMDLLLENQKLKFTSDMLLDGEIIRCRKASAFENRYLKKEFTEKITVIRILDSKNEKFTLSKAYKDKIDVINIITAPEIEMPIIISEGKYDKFKNSNIKKPSIYCKSELKYKDVKSYKFVYSYFSDINKLMKSIKEYKRISSKKRKSESQLFDILI
jgi:hypothetical protein